MSTDDEVPGEGEEVEGEYEIDLAHYPDTLSCDDGQVFFYPNLGDFCEAHEAKAVMVAHGGVFLLPIEGGKWYDVQDFGKASKPQTLRTVQ